MALEAIPVSENSGQSQSSVFELTSSAALIHTAASGTGFSELVYVWYAGYRRTRVVFSVKNSSGVIMQSDAIYLDKDVPFVLNPEQSLELSVDGAQVIYVLARAERSTLSGASLPVTITVNGGAYSTASAGSTVDIPVEYQSGGSEGISVVDGVVVVPDPDACDPASITTNGDSPALGVASGATQDIAIHDTAGADVGTRSGATVTIADGTVTVNGAGSIAAKAEGTTNVNVHDSAGADVGTLAGSTVTVADSAITVNGDALTDLRAEQGLDVEVEYAGGGVVPTTISAGKVLVPDSAPSVGMFPLKSGQTVSSATGDDGDLQFGRDADWLTLDGTNPWGNNYRFTGFTGGYYDQSAMSWKDSSGATVTEAVAIPEDIVIDWAHQKRDGSQVVGWGRVLQGPHAWVDFISNALAYSTTSFPTGWFPPGSKTFESICKHYVPTNFGFRLFYPPFNLSSIDVWSATEVGHASTQAIRFPASTTIPMFATAKTSWLRWLPCRIFNVSGTSLS